MLELTPRAWYSWDFHIRKDDEAIALLDRHWLREGASFTLDGAAYEVRRSSLLRGPFVLERDRRPIAEATKTSVFRRAFEIHAGPELWLLKSRSAFRREFVLLRGGLPMGTVRPVSAFRRSATADFPDAIPLPLQVFLACLVLLLWKRDAAAAAAG